MPQTGNARATSLGSSSNQVCGGARLGDYATLPEARDSDRGLNHHVFRASARPRRQYSELCLAFASPSPLTMLLGGTAPAAPDIEYDANQGHPAARPVAVARTRPRNGWGILSQFITSPTGSVGGKAARHTKQQTQQRGERARESMVSAGSTKAGLRRALLVVRCLTAATVDAGAAALRRSKRALGLLSRGRRRR